MGTNERVIMIKGDAGKWYDQAIFILNKDMPPEDMPKDFVREAEDIIRGYVAQKNKQAKLAKAYSATAPVQDAKPAPVARSAKKNKRFDTFLNLVMLLGCITIAAVFLFGIVN
jgi:hypothetical protein